MKEGEKEGSNIEKFQDNKRNAKAIYIEVGVSARGLSSLGWEYSCSQSLEIRHLKWRVDCFKLKYVSVTRGKLSAWQGGLSVCGPPN